jgi:hypothetical protein
MTMTWFAGRRGKEPGCDDRPLREKLAAGARRGASARWTVEGIYD